MLPEKGAAADCAQFMVINLQDNKSESDNAARRYFPSLFLTALHILGLISDSCVDQEPLRLFIYVKKERIVLHLKKISLRGTERSIKFTAQFISAIPIFFSKHKQRITMANEGNIGVFGDLFTAVGDLAQQATDMAGSAVKTATDTVQPVTNACVQLCTTAINSATQIVESATKTITTALTPKQ
jgi:chlorosome envelope protein F